jgi:hypothetical protein
MSQYGLLMGKRVEAQYRAGYLSLSAVGILVSDACDSICLEDHFLQNGKNKTMRVEIPYSCILRVSEAAEEAIAATPQTSSVIKKSR